MKKQADMNVAGIRRNIKNLAHNYSDAQIKVREATSNDPWGPSATIMAEVADLTYNVVAFSEIMQMIWKRLNDHGKNWRHVYKSLILLEYLIKTGTEKVAQQCKENIFAIKTLREFQYTEEGKDQGLHVREKAKQLVSLLQDDERLKNERTKALKAKERFAQHANGFGSDGSIDGPTHRETPTWSGTGAGAVAGAEEPPRTAPDIEFVRPQTAGEEELQLQLAMAMSREEADQEEAKRRSDDVRLQLAISQSEQDFGKDGVRPTGAGATPKTQQSHLLDLLDIDMGGTASPPLPEGWGMGPPVGTRPRQSSDPWSQNSSPPSDPWQPPKPLTMSSDNAWLPRTQSPSMGADNVIGWLNSSTTSSNGNMPPSIPPPISTMADPWLVPSLHQSTVTSEPWMNKPTPVADPWLPTYNSSVNQNLVTVDPWAPKENLMGARPSPVGAATLTSPMSDLDEFDIITNRSKSALSSTSPINNGFNNNNSSLLDDMDPLSLKNSNKQQSMTPQTFLGENSALVNLDYLIKPNNPPAIHPIGNNLSAYNNPFSDTTGLNAAAQIPPRNNLFHQTQPVPSINQLKQTPFPVTLNQDPWAPVNPSNTQQQTMGAWTLK